MARRRLLSDELWARHLEPPADEREITRHYTLGAEDLAQIAARRGDANRLGYALVLEALITVAACALMLKRIAPS